MFPPLQKRRNGSTFSIILGVISNLKKSVCDLTFSSCVVNTAVIFTWPNGSITIKRQIERNTLFYYANIATV